MKYHSKLFPKIKKGQVAEKIAELFLLKKGYYVFKNEFGLGPIDLIAVNEEGKVQPYDVKSVSIRSKNSKFRPGTKVSRALTLEQRKLKVKFLFVDKNGECHVSRS